MGLLYLYLYVSSLADKGDKKESYDSELHVLINHYISRPELIGNTGTLF
jgi:hypothetical protein